MAIGLGVRLISIDSRSVTVRQPRKGAPVTSRSSPPLGKNSAKSMALGHRQKLSPPVRVIFGTSQPPAARTRSGLQYLFLTRQFTHAHAVQMAPVARDLRRRRSSRSRPSNNKAVVVQITLTSARAWQKKFAGSPPRHSGAEMLRERRQVAGVRVRDEIAQLTSHSYTPSYDPAPFSVDEPARRALHHGARIREFNKPNQATWPAASFSSTYDRTISR